jgi:hypothetical protein
MSTENLVERLQRVEATDAIRDRLHAYCRGIDRRQPDMVTASFWPDAAVEYGIFNGNGHAFAGMICGALAASGCEATHHQLGNILLEIDGDSAISEAYLTAWHRLRREAGSAHDCVFGARYHDRLECRDGVWRIAFRRLVYDWVRNYPDTADWSVGALGVNSAVATIGDGREDLWAELNAALRSVSLPFVHGS